MFWIRLSIIDVKEPRELLEQLSIHLLITKEVKKLIETSYSSALKMDIFRTTQMQESTQVCLQLNLSKKV